MSGTTIRHNAAEVEERLVYLLSHPCLRLIGDRSMHGARTCSSSAAVLVMDLQFGGRAYHITVHVTVQYYTRDFSSISVDSAMCIYRQK